MFCITKWTRHITDSGKDEYTGRLAHMRARLAADGRSAVPLFSFRLLDDDGIVYAYGKSTDCNTEAAFAPLDRYELEYGCTEIQYRNPSTGKYETL